MPRTSRVCSVIDCNRSHHGKGFCRLHYGLFVRKPERKVRSAKRASQEPQNANREVSA